MPSCTENDEGRMGGDLEGNGRGLSEVLLGGKAVSLCSDIAMCGGVLL